MPTGPDTRGLPLAEVVGESSWAEVLSSGLIRLILGGSGRLRSATHGYARLRTATDGYGRLDGYGGHSRHSRLRRARDPTLFNFLHITTLVNVLSE